MASLPPDVLPDEALLLGDALFPGPEYQRALLRSSYRQELLLGEQLTELRAIRAQGIGLPVAIAPSVGEAVPVERVQSGPTLAEGETGTLTEAPPKPRNKPGPKPKGAPDQPPTSSTGT